MEPRPAAFLDRDGTLNEEAGYIDRLERLDPLPVRYRRDPPAAAMGYLVVVITNQAGVAQGFYGEDFVDRDRAATWPKRARLGGTRIDGHYYCPHSPDAAVEKYRVECECRKPRPGMAVRAARISTSISVDRSSSAIAGATSRSRSAIGGTRHPRQDRVRRDRGHDAAAGA